jgi:hypothetical protein
MRRPRWYACTRPEFAGLAVYRRPDFPHLHFQGFASPTTPPTPLKRVWWGCSLVAIFPTFLTSPVGVVGILIIGPLPNDDERPGVAPFVLVDLLL